MRFSGGVFEVKKGVEKINNRKNRRNRRLRRRGNGIGEEPGRGPGAPGMALVAVL
jgi:hypothetical protein